MYNQSAAVPVLPQHHPTEWLYALNHPENGVLPTGLFCPFSINGLLISFNNKSEKSNGFYVFHKKHHRLYNFIRSRRIGAGGSLNQLRNQRIVIARLPCSQIIQGGAGGTEMKDL